MGRAEPSDELDRIWEGLQGGDSVEVQGQAHSLKEWVGNYVHVEKKKRE